MPSMGDAPCPCPCPCPCPTSLEDLMLKLCSPDADSQREASLALRNLAKTSSVHRFCIGEIGAIPSLITLLSSPDTETQTHSVTALFNLTLRNDANKASIASDKGIDAVVQVMNNGGLEARENAAALLCNLSRSKASLRMICGEDLFRGLVGVLREGSMRGKRDAAGAMYNLLTNRKSRGLAVSAGAVEALFQIAEDRASGLIDESIAVLANLAGHRDGRCEMESPDWMQCLLALMREGSESNKEFACALLLLLCQHSSSVTQMLQTMGAKEPLLALSKCGTDRARRKALNILELL
ncbi:hypothetical protein GOP47_0015130 [Adiantum capillus-veneris]|uniref:U-box domain-containing protein n=1 Tax=Adiantum capillus-veneris TaxID=13818 RepID=A0A9D4UNA6_ADICA|nr:hypothetical protein GOP47_0015130 [Adiantum capillus-veneris]